MHHRRSLLLFFGLIVPAFFLLFSGCGHGSHREAAWSVADSFASHYFNWRFADAVRFATPSSRRWLSFAASQVDQDDIDSLRAMLSAAEITVEGVELGPGDTVALAVVKVTNFLSMDTIGQPPSHVASAHFRLSMVVDQGRWQIRMAGLPRSESKSPC